MRDKLVENFLSEGFSTSGIATAHHSAIPPRQSRQKKSNSPLSAYGRTAELKQRFFLGFFLIAQRAIQIRLRNIPSILKLSSFLLS